MNRKSSKVIWRVKRTSKNSASIFQNEIEDLCTFDSILVMSVVAKVDHLNLRFSSIGVEKHVFKLGHENLSIIVLQVLTL